MRSKWEEKILELQKELEAVVSALHLEYTKIGAEIAGISEWSSINGWSQANTARLELTVLGESLHLVSGYQAEWEKWEKVSHDTQKNMKGFEQKHRAALLKLGEIAWKHYLVGSPGLNQRRDLFEPMKEFEEKAQKLQVKIETNRRATEKSLPLIEKLSKGAETLWIGFRQNLEQGKRRSILLNLGKELFLQGAAENLVSAADAASFTALIEDQDSWTSDYQNSINADNQLTTLKQKAQGDSITMPFAESYRKLRAEFEKKEKVSAKIFQFLGEEWNRNTDASPEIPAGILSMVNIASELKQKYLDTEEILGRHQLAARAENLQKEAEGKRNHAKDLQHKVEVMKEEAKNLLKQAESQEKESQDLFLKSGLSG